MNEDNQGSRSLEANRERLEREVTMAPEPKPLLHPNIAELYRTKVAGLVTLLTGDGADPEAVGLIRSLVEEITLTPEDGELRVDLKGDPATAFICSSSLRTYRSPQASCEGSITTRVTPRLR